MKTTNKNEEKISLYKENQIPPNLKISKIAVISRDYRESGGNSDFSNSLEEILNYCDSKKCDSVLFSLYSLLEKNKSNVKSILRNLKYIKSIFVEEFKYDNSKREAGNFIVYFKQNNSWDEYSFYQKFGTLSYTKKFVNEVISPFIDEVINKRIFGNCTVLLCGESNIVKYEKASKKIKDIYGLYTDFPKHTKVILNPIHDKMTRFEMKLKRAFLSQNNKAVISVWNKGKTDSRGINRDGNNPPWTVFINGEEILLNKENKIFHSNSNSRIDVGILDLNQYFSQQ
jgi:hypothetical protein